MLKTIKDGFLEASVSLGNNTLMLKGDCAGKIIQVKYKKVDFSIHFPNFTDFVVTEQTKRKPTLENTEIVLNHLVNQTEEFGEIYSYNLKNNQEFSFHCKQLILQSTKPLSEMEAQSILELLPEWKDRFIFFLEILEFSSFDDDHKLITVTNPQIGWLIKSGGEPEYVKSGNHHMAIKAHKFEGVSVESLKKAVELCDTTEIPQFYRYLMDALKHFNREDYRHCVLDAATAYELCLTSLKDSYFQKNHVTEVIRESINHKYRQISHLTELIKGFYANEEILKNRLKEGVETVADIRNKAIHKGYEIKLEDAQKALNFVKDFIYSVSPIK